MCTLLLRCCIDNLSLSLSAALWSGDDPLTTASMSPATVFLGSWTGTTLSVLSNNRHHTYTHTSVLAVAEVLTGLLTDVTYGNLFVGQKLLGSGIAGNINPPFIANYRVI